MDVDVLLKKPLKILLGDNPVLEDFFSSFQIEAGREEKSFEGLVRELTDGFWEENTTNPREFVSMFKDFVTGVYALENTLKIESLDVLSGYDKYKKQEVCNLHLKPGEITCVVGPTGSGKSRLLADIEWLANEDTPTKRKVLINGQQCDNNMLAQYGGKLIAQITQNMNFVLDMDVEGFLMLHAQSRFLPNAELVVKEVIDLANDLSGESFTADTPVTFLSGGQSRALMIADVACIGQAPVVLIDEIENAGVNKKKALDLLVSKEKIVLMATHDPLLILLAHKRVVIKNGGMHKIINTNEHEQKLYCELERLDHMLQTTKDFFRNGNGLKAGDSLLKFNYD